MTSEVMPARSRTLEEREFLTAETNPKRSGFYPRSIQKLCTSKLPRTMVNIECNHFLRSSTDEAAHGHPPVTFRLWLEAGKHEVPFPERPETEYNSNVWRNFRKHYGFYTTSQGQKVTDMIATIYPLSIPAPSHVGSYTYARFLAETPLIKDPHQKKIAIERTRTQLRDIKEMSLKSSMRNPTMDSTGHIIPPLNFKRYEQRLQAPDAPAPASSPAPAAQTRTDIFGKQVPLPRRGPHLWKLSHKVTNPQFQHIDEQFQLKRSLPQKKDGPPSALTQRQSKLQHKLLE